MGLDSYQIGYEDGYKKGIQESTEEKQRLLEALRDIASVPCWCGQDGTDRCWSCFARAAITDSLDKTQGEQKLG